MNTPRVYLLWHSREVGDGESENKLVGVYSSRVHAEAAIARKQALTGFEISPMDL